MIGLRVCIALLTALFATTGAIAQTYWQQQVDYTIAVTLNDVDHVLDGQESFVYTNNSPVPLDTIWIHLWPNAYRDRNTALCEQLDRIGELDLHFAKEEERGYIDGLNFTANGSALTWGYHPEHADIGWILLPQQLVPGANTTISTPFHVKIPDGKFSRLGHTEQAYYITQWYPKPAVFDVDGWHAMPYLTIGEFYSEFGSFDVSITLPKNYVIGATGICQTLSEVSWMNELSERPFSATFGETSSPFPASDKETKTIRFTQEQIHDFAWFADKRYRVRKSKVVLPKSMRTVETWALFTPENAILWHDATKYLDQSVLRYSEWVGEYPYDACTAIDGTISAGGGMEYPMITVIGNVSSAYELDNVIAHEVGHNWFYGILGSNERDHAWMDEGMNSFIELRYMRMHYPNSSMDVGIPFFKNLLKADKDGQHAQAEWGYRLNARRNLDQPIDITSDHFTEINYGTMVYMKTALAFDHLFAFLGEETFDRCMHAYYDAWQFKHPQPKDVRAVFERESGKDLGWLFDGFIATDRKYDVKAIGLKGNTLTYRITGGIDAPFSVSSLDSTYATAQKPLWVEPNASGTIDLLLNVNHPKAVRIDATNRTLDIDRRNNTVSANGILKRTKLPEFRSLLGIEQQDRRSIYYTLAPACNGHDGWQAGLVLRNTTFPAQRTEWVLAPMYAFGSERVVGGARIEHHLDRIRSKVFRNINFGLSGRTASTLHDHFVNAWYAKVSPYIDFDLKRDPLSKPWQHRISVRSVYLRNSLRVEGGGTNPLDLATEKFFYELSYRAKDARKLHPALINPIVTYTANWLRASLELKQAFTYNVKNKQFRLRAFAGMFLWKSTNGVQNRLEAWGLTWGPQDMMYDHAYFERGATKGVLARQFDKQQGAFKTPFLQGGSETWIGSLNAEFDLPLPLPITLFASVGGVPVTTISSAGRHTNAAFYYEAGIGVQAIRDVLEVWFPVIVSQRIADEETFKSRALSDRIRFVFALDKLDPTRVLRGL